MEHGDFSYSRELTAMFDSAIAEESLYRYNYNYVADKIDNTFIITIIAIDVLPLRYTEQFIRKAVGSSLVRTPTWEAYILSFRR